MRQSLYKLTVALVSIFALCATLTPVAHAQQDYGIIIQDISVTSENADNILGDDLASVSYNPETNTLAFNNATLNTGPDRCNVCASKDLTIKVTGKNQLLNTNKYDIAQGIGVSGNLNITGDGSLDIPMEENIMFNRGINVFGNLSIDGPTITVKDSPAERSPSFAIFAKESITIKNSTITANGAGARWETYGIYAGKDLTISDSQVHATGELGGSEISAGIHARGSVSFSDSTVIASGESWALDFDAQNLSLAEGQTVHVSNNHDGSDAHNWDGTTTIAGRPSPYTYVRVEPASQQGSSFGALSS